MRSVIEWRRRILEYLGARGNHQYRATTKEKIFAFFGDNIDDNTYIAFTTLLQDNLVITCNSGKKEFYTLDFSKVKEIGHIIFEEINEEKMEMVQPDKNEMEGLEIVFSSTSDKKNPRQGMYYYCVKKDDHADWIALQKTKILGKAKRIILGSLNHANSWISKIWAATLTISEQNADGKFNRKEIEDFDPKSCGNNRQRSKAAFDIFERFGLIKVVGKRRNSVLYERTSLKPTVHNLEEFFTRESENNKGLTLN
ncbi:MAG: hypothetical protein WBF38_00845 [Nitrosotalea sp.]